MKTLKEARAALKYTQKQLADLAGISLTAYQGYERGERTPKVDTILKISNALNIDPCELFFPALDGLVTFLKDNNENLNDSIKNIREVGDRNTDMQKRIQYALNDIFSMLNQEGKKEALHRIAELSKVPDYRQSETDGLYRSDASEPLNAIEPSFAMAGDEIDSSTLFDMTIKKNRFLDAINHAQGQNHKADVLDLSDSCECFNRNPQVEVYNDSFFE